MFAYLDALNNVVAASTSEYTLEDAQALIPSITTIVSNAPNGLVGVGQESDRTPYHHRLVSGDGSSFSDYEPASTYTYSIAGDTLNSLVDVPRLAYEIENSSITTALERIGTRGDDLMVVFVADLSGAEETTLNGLVAAHKGNALRAWQTVVVDPTVEPVIPGASIVVANDRPAIEIETGVTGYGAMQQIWPLPQDADAELRATIKFILKQSGTGSTVRLAARMKSQATGADSSAAFTNTGFVAVPVTYTTIGEVFEGQVYLDASAAQLDDALALQVGRDGSNSLGAGDNDDVSVAIQVIALKVEAR